MHTALLQYSLQTSIPKSKPSVVFCTEREKRNKGRRSRGKKKSYYVLHRMSQLAGKPAQPVRSSSCSCNQPLLAKPVWQAAAEEESLREKEGGIWIKCVLVSIQSISISFSATQPHICHMLGPISSASKPNGPSIPGYTSHEKRMCLIRFKQICPMVMSKL